MSTKEDVAMSGQTKPATASDTLRGLLPVLEADQLATDHDRVKIRAIQAALAPDCEQLQEALDRTRLVVATERAGFERDLATLQHPDLAGRARGALLEEALGAVRGALQACENVAAMERRLAFIADLRPEQVTYRPVPHFIEEQRNIIAGLVGIPESLLASRRRVNELLERIEAGIRRGLGHEARATAPVLSIERAPQAHARANLDL